MGLCSNTEPRGCSRDIILALIERCKVHRSMGVSSESCSRDIILALIERQSKAKSGAERISSCSRDIILALIERLYPQTMQIVISGCSRDIILALIERHPLAVQPQSARPVVAGI